MTTTKPAPMKISDHAKALADAILSQPPACPSWCTQLKHPRQIEDCLEDCGYDHESHHKVPSSSHLEVVILDSQSIMYAYTPRPGIGVNSVGDWGTEVLVEPMRVDEAEALGKALLAAVQAARA